MSRAPSSLRAPKGRSNPKRTVRLLRVLRTLAMTSGWVVCLGFVPAAFADVVYDREGGTMKGLVVEEHRDRIVLGTEEGERTIPRSRIDEIFFSEPERNHLYLGDQALEAGEFDLADGFFRKALQINPRLAEAYDAVSRLEDLRAKQREPKVSNPLAVLKERMGLTLEKRGDWVTAAEVAPDSAAAQAGIAAGDALARYWDSSLVFLPAGEAARFLLGPAGSQVRMVVRRRVTLQAAGTGGRWPGAGFSMERLGLTVENVEPRGAAERAGLRPRDRVVQAGKEATRYLSLERARQRIEEGKAGGTLDLIIERDLWLGRK